MDGSTVVAAAAEERVAVGADRRMVC
ncbi:hypothetical protein A2U01_0046257, partial [Trifolium medium]|nr:hypothetical protein [Trifolium medium]